jgi:hypothetical protein
MNPYYDTQKLSREIFARRGYVLAFNDVKNNGNAYEDWYIHPDLVSIEYINKVKSDESLEYHEIIKILNNNN